MPSPGHRSLLRVGILKETTLEMHDGAEHVGFRAIHRRILVDERDQAARPSAGMITFMQKSTQPYHAPLWIALHSAVITTAASNVPNAPPKRKKQTTSMTAMTAMTARSILANHCTNLLRRRS